MTESAAVLEHYAIEPAMSRFTVRAFATGMLSALGHSPTIAIRDFSGEAEFEPNTLEKAALRFKVNASSLAVTDDISDKDRGEIERTMYQEVLETAKYPDIVFDSSNVSASKGGDGQYWINLIGTLTMHGISNNQPVSAQVTLNGDTLRAHGEFLLRQSTYGIKPVSVAGGTLKLKDELKCSFDIVARKKANCE